MELLDVLLESQELQEKIEQNVLEKASAHIAQALDAAHHGGVVFQTKIESIVSDGVNDMKNSALTIKEETEEMIYQIKLDNEIRFGELERSVTETKSSVWSKKHLHVIYVTIITFAILTFLSVVAIFGLLKKEIKLENREKDFELIIQKYLTQ